jgi:hypothetical protein
MIIHVLMDAFPNATTVDPDTHLLGLKPAGQFMAETINFIWPVIMVWFTSVVGLKAVMSIIKSLRGM